MNKPGAILRSFFAVGAMGVCFGYWLGARTVDGGIHELPAAGVPTGKFRALSESAIPNNGQPRSQKVQPIHVGAVPVEEMIDSMLLNFEVNAVEAWITRGELSPAEISAGLAYLSAKPKGTKHKLDLKMALYSAWAKHDADQAWSAALADADDPNGGSLLGAVAGEIAAKQPVAALARALTLGMGAKRGDVMAVIFEEWGKHDVAAAVSYWNAHPELPGGYTVIEAALKRAGEANPSFAASQALTLRNANDRGPVLAQVLIGWAEKDLSAALKWAQGIQDPELRTTQTAIVVDVLARNDPNAAMEVAGRIEDPDARASATRNAFHNLLEKAPADAMEYLAANPSEELIREVQHYFAYATKGLTFEEQKSLLAKVTDEEARQHIIYNIALRQTDHGNYGQSVELINSMTADTGERTSALRHLAQSWAKSDAQAAAAWLNTFANTPERDSAVNGFTQGLAATDPQGAINWASSISTPEGRERAMMNIAVQWLRKDHAAAEAWLGTLGWLTETEMAELRQNASSRSGTISY